jgi:hypothetical protein
LSQSASDVEEHGKAIESGGELTYAAGLIISSRTRENVDRPFRRTHEAFR